MQSIAPALSPETVFSYLSMVMQDRVFFTLVLVLPILVSYFWHRKDGTMDRSFFALVKGLALLVLYTVFWAYGALSSVRNLKALEHCAPEETVIQMGLVLCIVFLAKAAQLGWLLGKETARGFTPSKK